MTLCNMRIYRVSQKQLRLSGYSMITLVFHKTCLPSFAKVYIVTLNCQAFLAQQVKLDVRLLLCDFVSEVESNHQT